MKLGMLIQGALAAIGFYPPKAKSLINLPKFLKHRKEWKKQGGKISTDYPFLHEFSSDVGKAHGQYFHQDLLVASFIFERNPKRHIDVGSRIDGFVAHVAAFREIEILDIRNLQPSEHKNIKYRQQNLMEDVEENITDSVSCLHAIEHFGLGRYGDPIDVNGHIKGITNLVRMLKPDGILYISFPIGPKDEVFFNAHRHFHPTSILEFDVVKENLKLLRFDYVDDEGKLHQNTDVTKIIDDAYKGCGIYTFTKIT
jgi:SAM-dependent methyltransferase